MDQRIWAYVILGVFRAGCAGVLVRIVLDLLREFRIWLRVRRMLKRGGPW